MRSPRIPRRTLLRAAALGGFATAAPTTPVFDAPGLVRADHPVLTHGVQSGDVIRGSGLVWARADRPSRMIVEVSEDPGFAHARRVEGPVLTPDTDFTGKMRVLGHGRT